MAEFVRERLVTAQYGLFNYGGGYIRKVSALTESTADTSITTTMDTSDSGTVYLQALGGSSKSAAASDTFQLPIIQRPGLHYKIIKNGSGATTGRNFILSSGAANLYYWVLAVSASAATALTVSGAPRLATNLNTSTGSLPSGISINSCAGLQVDCFAPSTSFWIVNILTDTCIGDIVANP